MNLKAFYSNSHINIKKNFGNYAKIVKKYPRINDDCCLVCKFPSKNCNKHKFFFDSDNRVLINEVSVLGYYKKRPYDILTEDVRYFRNLKKESKNHVIYDYFYSLTKLLVEIYIGRIENITYIPSKTNRNQLMPLIADDIANDFNLALIDPENYIIHDMELHQRSSISKKHSLSSRDSFIKKIFKYKENNNLVNLGNILILDDILDSGLTIHHLSKTLKKCGGKNIYGAIWLRTTENSYDFNEFEPS